MRVMATRSTALPVELAAEWEEDAPGAAAGTVALFPEPPNNAPRPRPKTGFGIGRDWTSAIGLSNFRRLTSPLVAASLSSIHPSAASNIRSIHFAEREPPDVCHYEMEVSKARTSPSMVWVLASRSGSNPSAWMALLVS